MDLKISYSEKMNDVQEMEREADRVSGLPGYCNLPTFPGREQSLPVNGNRNGSCLQAEYRAIETPS